MADLPAVGGSNNTWGQELNDFMSIAHESAGANGGKLKTSALNGISFTGTINLNSATAANLPANTNVGTVLAAELSYLSGVTSGIQGQLSGKSSTTHTHAVSAGAIDVTATAAELNILDGVIATTAEINYSSGVTSGIQGQLSGKASTTHTHAVSAGATDVTATAAELNILDGVTATTAEINYSSGVTSGIQGQLSSKIAISGTVTQANLTTLTAGSGSIADSLHGHSISITNADTVDSYHASDLLARGNHTGTQNGSTISGGTLGSTVVPLARMGTAVASGSQTVNADTAYGITISGSSGAAHEFYHYSAYLSSSPTSDIITYGARVTETETVNASVHFTLTRRADVGTIIDIINGYGASKTIEYKVYKLTES